MAARPLLHIGYHKTATSWLQKRLFTPAHGYAPLLEHAQVDALILRPHALIFDPAPAMQQIAQAQAAADPDLTPVISSEILSGHPFFGGRESLDMAQRLHAICPEARILITIRDQMRLLPSLYMQYLRRGGTMTPAQFFAGLSEPGYFGFDPVHVEYHHLIGAYRARFGAENVHVLTQESLGRDRDAALSRLAAFAGNAAWAGLAAGAEAPTGVSYPEGAAWLLRRVNHLQASTLSPQPILRLGTTPDGLYRVAGYLSRRGPVQRLITHGTPVTAEVRRRFSGHFAPSNRALAAMVPGLDLSGYDGIA